MGRENIRRPQKALSARFVESVTEAGKYFDGQGLFLRVAPNGAKQWVQRIVIRGKRCELGLGSPPAVELADARKLAVKNRGKAMLGGDPLAEKRAAQNKPLTFSECVDAYAEAKLSEFRSDKHRKQWRSAIERLAVPTLGNMPVQDIRTKDVLRMLEPHWRERTITAKKLRGQVEAILTWATVSGHREGDNPAAWRGNLKELLPAPGKVAKAQNHPSLALCDVSAWWNDIAQRDGMAARALEFVTLTAARSGEVRGMTWDEISIEPRDTTDTTDETRPKRVGLWTIPASRMKGGRAHRVPLTPEAVALLESLPTMNDSPYVFFAARGGMLSDMSLSAVMRRMQEAQVKAGAPGYLDPASKRPAVPHGLRSTFRQWAAERGYPRDMAEIALAHFIGSEVERAYQRSDMLDRRRDMMAAWGAFLRSETSPTDKVIRIA
ncbi:tyrosine-type recombinase/integrase [Meridianimarinicoccus aquatilis]|uniref:Site-specific integrase n=1 Tax=Meridianimarinicoccus aquatilis TaxID=2552766 RepID=A0A4R6AVH9_9RHOB|nr:site-specific integrase [Fluviibacterium aquatile]TDL86798.1 site-specific integrase [Fluviibacterium aquatile]